MNLRRNSSASLWDRPHQSWPVYAWQPLLPCTYSPPFSWSRFTYPLLLQSLRLSKCWEVPKTISTIFYLDHSTSTTCDQQVLAFYILRLWQFQSLKYFKHIYLDPNVQMCSPLMVFQKNISPDYVHTNNSIFSTFQIKSTIFDLFLIVPICFDSFYWPLLPISNIKTYPLS